MQVGACIVSKDNKIVGIGYNGFPLRVSDDDPDMTWGKGQHGGGEPIDPVNMKYPYGELYGNSYIISTSYRKLIILYSVTGMLSMITIVVHAEVNAIMHKTCIDLRGCTLYTTLFPCNECAKVIVQCGIERIFYLMDDHRDRVYMIAS